VLTTFENAAFIIPLKRLLKGGEEKKQIKVTKKISSINNMYLCIK
jgi:hypothetical protein